MSKRPTICLNMIVKNESHIIAETLETMCPYIDDYIINDTGSTDNTIEVIETFFTKRGIPGKVFSNEFREFDYARTTALELCCHSKSKYIWVIDADDILKGVPIFPENMNDDSYCLQYGTSFIYMRCQIFKNDPSLGWHYVGWVHEYPQSIKQNITEGTISGCTIDSRRLGDRSKNPNKYLNDALKLEKSYNIRPNSRDLFYCANSYFDHVSMYETFKDDPIYENNTKKFLLLAAKNYKQRISEKDFPEEVFYSYLRLAETYERLEFPWINIEEVYLEAYNFFKARGPEAIFKIMMHYQDEKNWQKAYDFGKMAINIPFPSQCRLFINRDTYTYKFALEYSVAASNLKKNLEGYLITKQLQKNADIYDYVKKTLAHNLEYFISCTKTKSKNCVLYVGDRSTDATFFEILEILNIHYNVYLVSNMVDITKLSSSTFLTDLETVKKSKAELKIKKVFLYDNLNMLQFLGNFSASHITLIQISNNFTLVYKNNATLTIKNKQYLEQLLSNVSVISSFNNNIPIENKGDVLSFSVDDTIKLCESKLKFKYTIKEFENDRVNGIDLYMPAYSSINQAYKYVETIMKQNNRPELYIYYANLCESNNSNVIALEYIEKAIALSGKSAKPILNMYKAKYLYNLGEYTKSYDIASSNYDLLEMNNDEYLFFEDIKDKNIDHIKDTYLVYPKNIINSLKKGVLNTAKIVVTMTTCKRYDLFEKTMNSFINCCKDIKLIDYWVCVDDNSSDEDRNMMALNYPFINYIHKGPENKGHNKSMNMIHDIINKNINIQYTLHLEDDFHFISKRNYIQDAINILKSDTEVQQVLFNRNYMEVENYKHRLPGGFIRKGYVIHEHYKPGKEHDDAVERYKGKGGLQLYWPHFSFRPSVTNATIYRELGAFCNVPHFEMQYAKEYVNKDYKSAFFNSFNCIHIGKKTWETIDNSYTLNGVNQFIQDTNKIDIKVVNYSKNPISKKLKDTLNNTGIRYEVVYREHFNITDSNCDMITKLFKNNNFSYAPQVISKIMLHKNILEKIEGDYCIVINNDCVFDRLDINDIVNQMSDPFMNLCPNTNQISYIITKSYAKHVLNYININGIVNSLFSTENKTLPIFTYDEIKEQYFEELEGYTFLSQLDSYGNDIRFAGRLSIEQLKILSDADPKCVGFNTNGWLKYKINNDLCKLYMCTRSNQGLYIKKIDK